MIINIGRLLTILGSFLLPEEDPILLQAYITAFVS
jgi:hypothetical protein